MRTWSNESNPGKCIRKTIARTSPAVHRATSVWQRSKIRNDEETNGEIDNDQETKLVEAFSPKGFRIPIALLVNLVALQNRSQNQKKRPIARDGF
jgi:hypothetical protein